MWMNPCQAKKFIPLDDGKNLTDGLGKGAALGAAGGALGTAVGEDVDATVAAVRSSSFNKLPTSMKYLVQHVYETTNSALGAS